MGDTTGNQTRRRFLLTTGGAATATMLAGCSGGNGNNNGSTGNSSSGGRQNATTAGTKSKQTTQPSIEGDPSKTLKLINETISTLDPIAATDTASIRVIRQMFDTLMNYPHATTEIEPQLVTDYSSTTNGKEYIFKLKDAKFHNGEPVTAEDFVYSWERLAQSDNSKRASYLLDTAGVKHDTIEKDGDEVYKPNSLAVKAPDEKTFQVTLESPFHAALEMFAYASFAVVPKNIVGDIKGVEGQMSYTKFVNGPIGAGPFKFKTYESGTQAAVERFDEYHDEKATIAGIHWQIIPKAQAQYQYFMGKNVDGADIPTAQYDSSNVHIERGPDKQGRKFGTYGPMENGETANYLSVPTINTYYIGFNMSKVPKPARQAFAYVANQKQLVEQVFKGRGQAAYHFTPPAIYPGGVEAYTKHAKQNYPYSYNKTDVAKAKRAMEDAGYGPDNKLTVNWTQYEDASWLQLGRLFRDQLQAVHIDLKIQQADFATLLERGRSGKLEAYTLGWIAAYPAPDNFLKLLYPPNTDTSKPAPVSYLNWSADTGDAAKKAKKSYQRVLKNQAPTDKAENARNKAYPKVESANWEDVGLLPLYHQIDEFFSYPWVDIPAFGAMGRSRQTYNDVKIAKQRK